MAANLLHLGASHAGLIAHEDLIAAEFLAVGNTTHRRDHSVPNHDRADVATFAF